MLEKLEKLFFLWVKNWFFKASCFGYYSKGCLSATPSFSLLAPISKKKVPNHAHEHFSPKKKCSGAWFDTFFLEIGANVKSFPRLSQF